jgi:hypothetical protein
MGDTVETKKYLINIESNLAKYAEDAAKAKKEVDDLKTANELLKKSGATPAEIEASNAALKNKNDEYRKAQTLLKTAIAYNQSESGSRKQLSEQLKLQEQALGKLGNAYVKNAQGQKVLNPLYIEQRKEIAATKKAIIDYDLALNDGRSNIGRYGESVESALSNIGRLPGPIGVAANSVKGFGAAMKAAFITNPIGIAIAAIVAAVGALVAIFRKFDPVVEAVERAMAGIKAVFSGVSNTIIGLVTGQTTLKEAFTGLGESIKEAYNEGVKWKQLQQDLFNMTVQNAVADAKRKTQIDELLLQSKNRSKTEAERMQLIEQALLLEEVQFNEQKKIADARVDLAEQTLTQGRAFTAQELKLLREKGVVYANELQKTKGITDEEIQAYSDALVAQEQVSTESIAIREKAQNRSDALDDKAEQKRQKEAERKQKAKDELRKQDIDWNKEQDDFIADTLKQWDKEAEDKWNSEVELQRKIFEQNRKAGKEEFDARIEEEEALAKAVIAIQETLADSKMNIAGAAVNFLSAIAGKNKSLQNAALIAEKSLAIAEVVINTTKANAAIRSMAAASVLPGPGYLVRLGASMTAAMAPINLNRAAAAIDIAAIIAATASQVKSNSQSSTSSTSGPNSIGATQSSQHTIAPAATIFQPQMTQTQLNAAPQQSGITGNDVINAIKSMPAPIVTVEDINARSNEVNKVAVRATI